MEAALKEELAGKNKSAQAQVIGKVAAERALDKGIKTVVFDRSGYVYTARVAKVAEGARQAGPEL